MHKIYFIYAVFLHTFSLYSMQTVIKDIWYSFIGFCTHWTILKTISNQQEEQMRKFC